MAFDRVFTWPEPARWLHYHLLDGDLASNTLSWQWIAGTFSTKKYIANQQNINKYSGQDQNMTWLDMPYAELAHVGKLEHEVDAWINRFYN